MLILARNVGAMNERPCRIHAFLAGQCFLCGATDEHKHCYSDWHACAFPAPAEHERPRRPAR